MLKYIVFAAISLLTSASLSLSSETGKGDQGLYEYTENVELEGNISLKAIVRSPRQPKATVLLLHGFPETSIAWTGVIATLSRDYEVHAFDWPGYGRSSRPSFFQFGYSPREYADVLQQYIRKSQINTENLIIYATDIGALPALLAAIDNPRIAQTVIVSDFAPFDRPELMHDRLLSLKSEPSASKILSAYRKSNSADIFKNAILGGSPKGKIMDLEPLEQDVISNWVREGVASYEAFFHYYLSFTRDQHFFEKNLSKVSTEVKILWGEQDTYIKKEMGIELAERLNAPLQIVAGGGHYLHIDSPDSVIEQIQESVP